MTIMSQIVEYRMESQTYQSTACLTAPAALRAARSDPELNEVSECDPFFTVGSLMIVR